MTPVVTCCHVTHCDSTGIQPLGVTPGFIWLYSAPKVFKYSEKRYRNRMYYYCYYYYLKILQNATLDVVVIHTYSV